MNENPMKEIRIEKVTLNIGCGSDQDKLKRAQKLLENLSEQKPFVTRAKTRTTFGVPKNKAIGVKVTLRKEKALNFLKDTLQAVDNEVKERQINDDNFSIGIKEYIDLPKANYDPEVGILGMDVCVTLERRGYSIKKQKNKKSKIGRKHLITKNEIIEWLKNNFGVNIIG
jgi:large subunit ribosomal protein L5